MAAQFPTAVPVYTNPTASMTLGSADHVALHSNVNDDVIGLATKMGKGASVPNLAGVLRVINTGTQTTGWGPVVNADVDANAAIAISKLAAMVTKSLMTSNGTTNSASTNPTVSGSLVAEAGLNAGTTGAATGEIKTSSHAKIGGGVYPSNQSTAGFFVPLVNQTLAGSSPGPAGSITVAANTRTGFFFVYDYSAAEAAIFSFHTVFNTTKLIYGNTGVWTDSVTATAGRLIFTHSSGNFILTNNLAGAQTIFGWLLST